MSRAGSTGAGLVAIGGGLLLVACADAPDETGRVVDADGDGAPAWSTVDDPALADCDDRDPSVTPDTERYVPSGPFVRGDDREADTSPAGTIRLSGFCIDRVEVTNRRFVAFLQEREDAGASNRDEKGLPLYSLDDAVSPDTVPARIALDGATWSVTAGWEDHPVVEVWHHAAVAWCSWVGRRLPTEAEWEKAARGTDARAYPWGDGEPTCEVVDAAVDLESEAAYMPCLHDTTPVGSYPEGASPFGALDMAGNAAEWVADWYAADAYDTADPSDPEGPAIGDWIEDPFGGYRARVSRGGNYTTPDADLRTWARAVERWDGTSNGLGFRCARSVPGDRLPDS